MADDGNPFQSLAKKIAGRKEKPESRAAGAGEAAPEGLAGEDALFAKAMQGVAPVNGKGRDLSPPPLPSTPPAGADPAKALREILEGRVEFALRHSDEYMEGFAVGLDPLVMARLKAGRYSPEKHLDLHGMNARQAFDALTFFVKDAYQRTMRCVVVVTGRGRNSPDGVGVLRPMVQQWFCRDPFKRVVLAFCTALPADGGPGAFYVLLRKYKKSRGKIIWERAPTADDFPDV
jgi:DNA-nicking Smr family endonuclease